MEQSKQERKEQAREEYRRIEKLARAELELKLRAIEAEEGLA